MRSCKPITREEHIWPIGRNPKFVGERGLKLAYSRRDDVIVALAAISEDTVVVSHFVAINVAVGAALDDPRVTCFRPDSV